MWRDDDEVSGCEPVLKQVLIQDSAIIPTFIIAAVLKLMESHINICIFSGDYKIFLGRQMKISLLANVTVKCLLMCGVHVK